MNEDQHTAHNTVRLPALLARLNRRLAHEGSMGQRLRTTRGARAETDLGRYYVLDLHTNSIMLHHVNPEALGRKLGVLEKGELVQ